MPTKNIDALINRVAGGATQRALRALWEQLRADQAANKTTFDAHTHNCALDGTGVTACLDHVGLAIDANTEDVQTTRAFDYVIAGVAYYKAAVAAIDISALAFTATTLATNTSRVMLFTIDATGTIDVVEGADLTGSSATAAVIPDTPSGECGFAAIRLGNKAVGAFKLGSDDLSSGSWNVEYVDLISNEPVITSGPSSDTADVAAVTADTFQNNLRT